MVLAATQLGGAVVASALSPDEGLAVFAELQKARRCFVLENELHTIYLVRTMLSLETQVESDSCLLLFNDIKIVFNV